ncbi:hypothetical protein EV421DRAFT_1908913 [Armillaria borealis]|uniref:Uncharacterized protein n=1 Tax=Armillaria borealis TaxID=47425 RepID=A0AA39J2R7_9AGAR|nr:hypothetical protein EV421DRAFT_1908913 [Armillaria borealis]
MQCKSLVAALLALSIVFVSAAPIPDLPGGADTDVEDVGQVLLPAIDSSLGMPSTGMDEIIAINLVPAIMLFRFLFHASRCTIVSSDHRLLHYVTLSSIDPRPMENRELETRAPVMYSRYQRIMKIVSVSEQLLMTLKSFLSAFLYKTIFGPQVFKNMVGRSNVYIFAETSVRSQFPAQPFMDL